MKLDYLKPMIILRSQNDFPQKVEELKSLYPSKKIAMVKIDEAIDYLRKVGHHRQYTQADELFNIQVVLHFQLKEFLEMTPEWEQQPIAQKTFLNKLKNFFKKVKL